MLCHSVQGKCALTGVLIRSMIAKSMTENDEAKKKIFDSQQSLLEFKENMTMKFH